MLVRGRRSTPRRLTPAEPWRHDPCEHIPKRHTVLSQVDEDDSGFVDHLEFLMFADVERTPFAKKIFDIFDHDLSGELDFVEFVCAVWNFCTMDDADIVTFAFECFGSKNPLTTEWMMDDKGVGFLMDSLFNRDTQQYKVTKDFFEDIIYKSGMITEREWTKWTQHNRRALRPLLEIRTKVRRRCVGNSFWKRMLKYRKRAFHRMRFHDIEKMIDSKRRAMPPKQRAPKKVKAKLKPIAMPVAAERRASSVATGDDPSAPRWDDEGPAPRRKPKRRKFKVVNDHGYEQSVPCGSDDEDVVEKPQTPAEKAIVLYRV